MGANSSLKSFLPTVLHTAYIPSNESNYYYLVNVGYTCTLKKEKEIQMSDSDFSH